MTVFTRRSATVTGIFRAVASVLPTVPLVLALASPAVVMAQDRTSLQAGSDEGVVFLRWTWPEGSLDPPPWQIYRRDGGGGGWKLLNPFPIERVSDESRARNALGEKDFERFRAILFPDAPSAEWDLQGRSREETARQLWSASMLTADMYPRVADLMGVRYEDRSVVTGKNYLYRLMALVDGREVLAAQSRPVKVQKAVLPAPAGVEGEAGDRTVSLRWNVEQRFSSYDIYRGGKPKGRFTKVNEQPVLLVSTRDGEGRRQFPPWFYLDEGLENGRTYYYSIQGRDFMGRLSRVTVPLELTPEDQTAPPPPGTFKASVEGNRIVLRWVSPEDRDLHGTNVYRSRDSTKGFVKLNNKPVRKGREAFTDKEAAPGVAYWYYATSVDRDGNESGRSLMSLGQIADVSPPSTPDRLTASVDPGIARIAWRPSPEADVRGYRLYRATDPEAETWIMLNQVPVPEPEFTDVLPETGNRDSLYYRVTAVDLQLNESDPSRHIEVNLPDVTPPSQPVFSGATAAEGQIRLSWHESGDLDLAGYRLFRSVAGARESDPLLLNDQLLETGTREYVDSRDLLPGRKYHYTLVAVDEDGNNSVPSRPITAATFDRTPPEVPSGVDAEVSPGREGILVTWEVPEGRSLKGVILYRARSQGGTFYPLTDFTKGASFLDESVREGRTYWYRLAAFDASNNRSGFSRTVNATFKRKTETE